MAFQDRADDFPLHAHAPAVDDPDLSKAALNRLIQVFLDNNMDLAWLKRVQVDRVFDW
jgi:hypothetical protein